ncbi:baculoviral IAP repeat-containing protein 5 [Parasteatoda tepidariorum]|nr:baculoviral IAP repeat-containing protein 5 [Parasteatoda tepidariorum]
MGENSFTTIGKEKYDSMYTEAMRLNSFQNWPFDDNSVCSASKMAEAGFFHCPTENEPDLVQCYVCFKELDGWEATDEPWSEHFSHSKICLFAKLRKPQNQLTVAEVYSIEAARKSNKTKRYIAQRIKEFRTLCEEVEDFLLERKESFSSSRTTKK